MPIQADVKIFDPTTRVRPFAGTCTLVRRRSPLDPMTTTSAVVPRAAMLAMTTDISAAPPSPSAVPPAQYQAVERASGPAATGSSLEGASITSEVCPGSDVWAVTTTAAAMMAMSARNGNHRRGVVRLERRV